MSARALNWAWGQKPATSSQKLVLAALADRADEDGECFPSLKWISEKCAPLTQRAVRDAVTELAAQGLVEKVHRRRRGDGTLGSWIYRLPIDTGVSLAGPRPVTLECHTDSRHSIRSVLTDVRTGESRASAKERKPDPLWDGLVAIFGAEAVGLERGRWNAALKSLRAAGATPDQLRSAAARYRQVMPEGCLMTATALAANWTLLTAEQKGEAVMRFEAGRDEWRAKMIARRGWA